MEININEEDNNNIYIENSQNKNKQIEISKKRQKHLIYYINPNIDNISNNYFIFYKKDCYIKFKKDCSKGSANFIFLFFVNEVSFKFSLSELLLLHLLFNINYK